MFRRHFFLTSALAVLVLMAAVVGVRLLTPKSAGAGASPPAAQGSRPPGGARAMAVAVTPTSVKTHEFRDELEVLGVAKGRQSVTLTAAATQLVRRVRFRDGDVVSRGAVLVELTTTEQQAGVAQAEAHLLEARRAYDRYRKLGESGYASKASVDQYEAAYRSALADVAAARARQADRTIRAPFSGVVGLSDVAPGALINPGSPIVTLDDLSAVRVDFQAPELYITQLRPGMVITATADAYPGESFVGRIATLDTRVDARTRAITARAEFPNPAGRLKGGMMMRIHIARGAHRALAVQESAVAMQGDSAFVFVVRREGARTVVEQRPVVTGLRQDGFVEITDGVDASETLVADGLNKIRPGQPVRVVGARPGQPAA